MDKEKLIRALNRYSGRANQAARMVLLDGVSRKSAAQIVGVDPAAVTRSIDQVLAKEPCPCCGQTVRKLKES